MGTGGFVLFGQDITGSGYNRDTMHEVFPACRRRSCLPRNSISSGKEMRLAIPRRFPTAVWRPSAPPPLRGRTNHPFKKHAIGVVVSGSGASALDGMPVSTSKPLHDISALPDGRLLCSTLDRKSLGIVDSRHGRRHAVFHFKVGKTSRHPSMWGRAGHRRAAIFLAPARDTGRGTGRFFCQNVFNTKQIHADLDRIKAVRVIRGTPLDNSHADCHPLPWRRQPYRHRKRSSWAWFPFIPTVRSTSKCLLTELWHSRPSTRKGGEWSMSCPGSIYGRERTSRLRGLSCRAHTGLEARFESMLLHCVRCDSRETAFHCATKPTRLSHGGVTGSSSGPYSGNQIDQPLPLSPSALE